MARAPLKPLANIAAPDDRNLMWVSHNTQTGASRALTIDDFHRAVSGIDIKSDLPPDVRGSFDTVRNLLLYSWYVYDFSTPAFLLMHTTVEWALKERLAADGVDISKHKGLRKLLKEAIRRKWLYDRDFEDLLAHSDNPERATPEATSQAYVATLAEIMRHFRNSLAHGGAFLMDPFAIMSMVEIAARLIDVVYRANPSAEADAS